MFVDSLNPTGLFRAACFAATFLAGQAQAETYSDLESQMWEFASEEGTQIALQTFIYSFPNSSFVDDAQEKLAGVVATSDARALEDAIFELAGDVRFDTPLHFLTKGLEGKSLEQVLESSPLYPPVEGLPAEYWENQNCSSCHQWNRETLCGQAENYVEMDPNKYRNKMHPFGGVLKVNLRNWAQNGCQ